MVQMKREFFSFLKEFGASRNLSKSLRYSNKILKISEIIKSMSAQRGKS